MPYTAVYVDSGDGAVLAFVTELPGARVTGLTVEEARERLRIALKMVLDANRQCCFRSAEGMRRLHTEPIDEMP